LKKQVDVGAHSAYQLYVTRAYGLSASEVTRAFERFGTLNECVELASSFPGVAFVKFRAKAAAKAAVDQSPIEHAGQWLYAEFMDLTRQTKNAEYNREQERKLIRDEPVTGAVRPMFQFYSSLPSNQLRLNPGKSGRFVTKVRNVSGIDQELLEIDILPKNREFHPLIRRCDFPVRLMPDESYAVNMEFRPGRKTRIGFHRLTIKFKFRVGAPLQGSVDVNVFDEEDYAALEEPCAASDDRDSVISDEPLPRTVVAAFPPGCRDGAANRIFVEQQLEQRFRAARPGAAEYLGAGSRCTAQLTTAQSGC
jgi:hypothetical protein